MNVKEVENKIKFWATKMEKSESNGDMKTYNKSVEKVQYYEMLYDDLTFG
jgi:hypothetical protein